MKHLLTKGMIALTLALTPVVASATPITVGIGAFSGSETVLTFDGVATGQIITADFVPQGVDFSASHHVSGSASVGSVPGDAWPLFTTPGLGVLQNYLGGTGLCTSVGTCQPIVIDFVTPMQFIGMDMGTNPGTSVFTVENTLGTSTVFNIPTTIPEAFVGFFDVAGINRITIDATATLNGAIGLNDLRFEQPVPEPSTMILLGSGLVGLVAWRFRKQQA